MSRLRGFTMIELLIVIVVIGIIAAACAPVVINAVTAYNKGLQAAVALDKLRYASERLAREIRDSAAGTLTISSASVSAPSFTRMDYVVGDMSTGSTLTSASTSRSVAITQNTSTGIVTLAYGTTSATLMDQMCSSNPMTFTYYDSSNCKSTVNTGGTCTVSSTTVKYVEIFLCVLANGQQYTQRTRVALRNQ